MKRLIVTSMLILSALLLKQSFAQTHSEWVTYKGEYVYVSESMFDPDFPISQVANKTFADSAYLDYLSAHLFPLPGDGDYDKQLEQWLLNNKNYFPRFLSTGNAASDSVRFKESREFWMKKNEQRMVELSGSYNPTGFAKDDFSILFESFPRMENSGDVNLDRELYNDAVQEWIRLYSFEKFLIIEPLVRESDELLKLKEGK